MHPCPFYLFAGLRLAAGQAWTDNVVQPHLLLLTTLTVFCACHTCAPYRCLLHTRPPSRQPVPFVWSCLAIAWIVALFLRQAKRHFARICWYFPDYRRRRPLQCYLAALHTPAGHTAAFFTAVSFPCPLASCWHSSLNGYTRRTLLALSPPIRVTERCIQRGTSTNTVRPTRARRLNKASSRTLPSCDIIGSLGCPCFFASGPRPTALPTPVTMLFEHAQMSKSHSYNLL